MPLNSRAGAVRSLVRAPLFTIAAVVTLALGIGATTAIFSVVNAVLLRPLPYADPGSLVLVWADLRTRDALDVPFAPADFHDLRTRVDAFEAVAGVSTFSQPLLEPGIEPEQIEVAGVTPGFFEMLGVHIARGRAFTEAESLPPEQPDPAAPPGPPPPGTVILSWEFWQRRYAGDPSVVGRMITMGSAPTRVIGILEAGFEVLLPPGSDVARRPDAYIPMRIDFASGSRSSPFLRVIGRLAPGATLARAQAQADALAAELRQSYEAKNAAGLHFRLVPMHADLVEGIRPAVRALMGAVLFVLLIACANVAGLLLVRAGARERELAVRATLGATRGRLLGLVMRESLLLGIAGAALGLGIAWAGIRVLTSMTPESLPRLDAVAIDTNVLLFTAITGILAALAFGIVPALRASRVNVGSALRATGRTAALGAGGRLRSAVVVAEVALSFVLLIGSGLMLRSFLTLQRTDAGFDAQNVETFAVRFAGPRYADPEVRAAFKRELHARFAAIPGVTAVTGAAPLPLDGSVMNAGWGTEAGATDAATYRQANVHVVLPGYFEALRTPVLEGRAFTAADNSDAVRNVVIDEVLARRAFPNGSAVGQRLYVRLRGPDPEPLEVIGVVRHQRHASLAEEGREALFVTDGFLGHRTTARWALRVNGDPAAVLTAARAEVARLDPSAPVSEVLPLRWYVNQATASTRFAFALIAAFAAIAVILAAVGLYSVIATVVRQRTAEIGVRMAFGAQPDGIFRLVVRQGLTLGLLGMAAGVVAAIALTRLLSSMLVGVTPTDPLTFGAMAALFLLVVTIASGLPAWRAASMDPNAALRLE